MKKEKQAELIESILQAMENPGQWKKTWKDFGNQRNPETGTFYKGVNSFLLSCEKSKKNYEHGQRLTYKGAVARGGHVLEGEKATAVIYYSPFSTIDKKTGDKKIIPLLKLYHVFNICQTTCEPVKIEEGKEITLSSYSMLDQIIGEYGTRENLKIVDSTEPRCYYTPATDIIHMTPQKHFVSSEAYYHTLCHEMIHSTGADSRLKRKLTGTKYGNDNTDYSIEELIAEFGACILGSKFFEIDIENSGNYLASRAKEIRKQDKHAEVISAISKANKAVDYIRG